MKGVFNTVCDELSRLNSGKTVTVAYALDTTRVVPVEKSVKRGAGDRPFKCQKRQSKGRIEVL